MIDYQEQHKQRLSWMPWLYPNLKPELKAWATAWQAELQQELLALEKVVIGSDCFIAPSAQLFAEPGRPIVLGNHVHIAADAVLHGPITVGDHVSINHHATLDGGRAGIRIGADTRIAAYVTIYAFNHGYARNQLVRSQRVTSNGIEIGTDVWIGARAGIVDGVRIGDGAVVAMNSQVINDVPAGTVVGGNPAETIAER